MSDKPKQTGPKLDDIGRAIVRSGVLNGLSNEVINGNLVDSGYPSLSPTALWEYRRHSEIREAIGARVEEISDAAYIELGNRLRLLNSQVEELLLLMAEYGEYEEIVGSDKDGEPIKQKKDSRKTRDYTDKKLLLITFLDKISRLVDRFDGEGRGGRPTIPQQPGVVQQALTPGQVMDTLAALIAQKRPDKAAEIKAITGKVPMTLTAEVVETP